MTSTLDNEEQIWSSMVSVDDHVLEPPTLWTDRLPKADHERGPRMERMTVREAVQRKMTGVYETVHFDPEGNGWVDIWRYEDLNFPILSSFGAAGIPSGEIAVGPAIYDQFRPGCWEREPRLADMDVNGVELSLTFPNMFIRFCGQRFLEAQDKGLALRSLQAYNDWLTEDWSGPSNGRLYGAYIVPLWDVQLAVTEIERIAGDAKVVCFSEIPTRLGLPSLYCGYWDPLFEACERNDIVVAMHIGSSSSQARTSDDAPPVLFLANHYTVSSLSLSDWLLSGMFEKFPKLKIIMAESQAGWIPYLIERLDRAWHRHDPYLYSEDVPPTPKPPSEYLREHVFTCIFDDPSAMAHLDMLEDIMCFETDYPHSDGTWPYSAEVAKRHTEGISASARDKILRTNGLRLLGLD